MKIVVKYGNRKLYDKDTAKYINLSDLVKLPIGSFKVEKYGTGEDITTDTLLSALTSENVQADTKVKVMQHCINELQTVSQ